MKMLCLISLLLAVTYIVMATWRAKQLPDSISALVYSFGKPGKWLWTLWLWTVTFLFTPAMFDAMDGSIFQFVGFFTVAALLFCGAMPLVPGEHNRAHYAFAYAAGICSQLSVMLICPWWLLLWFILVPLVASSTMRILEGKGVFILECLCYTTLIAAILSS